MEHVEGRADRPVLPRARAVDRRTRRASFSHVCAAVEAPHQHLIVHRDLKPGNILVTADGAPKLLDFGIAKLLDPLAYDWTVAETEHGRSPHTLRYASPEQVRGEPVSTATDVYSLGVVLYELLTERSPYAGVGGSLSELSRAICDSDPPPPSSTTGGSADAATGATAARRVESKGDLDAIVLRALRKDPPDRYRSVEALAEDLRRSLDGRPVEARGGAFAYRASRFVRRHRWAVAAAALLVAVFTGWAVSLARQLERTRLERDNARAVTELLVDIFKVSDPESGAGGTLTAREILDRGSGQAATKLADRPEILARLLHALGRVYQNLGLYDQALDHLERAVALRRPERERDREGFAVLLADTGWLFKEKNQFERAEAVYREALDLLGPRDDSEARRTVLGGLAGVKRSSGDLAGAEPIMVDLVRAELAARGLAEPPLAEGPPLGDEYRRLAVDLHNLGALEMDLGRYDDAARYLNHSLAVKSRYTTPNPASLANTYQALANVEDSRQRYADALGYHERALELRRGVYGEDHPAIAESLFNRAGALSGLDRPTEALADYLRARAIFEEAYGVDHLYVAMAANNSANALWALGRLDEAEKLHREALEIREKVAGPNHPDVVLSLQNLGGLMAARSRPAEALPYNRRAVEVATLALGTEHPDTLDCRLALAKDRLALGETAAAAAELEVVVAALERGQREHSLADGRFALARALVASGGDRARAIELATRAREALVGRTGIAGTLEEEEVATWLASLESTAASSPSPVREARAALPGGGAPR